MHVACIKDASGRHQRCMRYASGVHQGCIECPLGTAARMNRRCIVEALGMREGASGMHVRCVKDASGRHQRCTRHASGVHQECIKGPLETAARRHRRCIDDAVKTALKTAVGTA